jgi:hypothetical protein
VRWRVQMITITKNHLPLLVAAVLYGAGCDDKQQRPVDADGFVGDGPPPGSEQRPPKTDGPTLPPDSGPPAPAQLPTWVNIDWAAFPVDPGPNYKVQGRVWVVKTTGNDSNDGSEASPLRSIATALDRSQSGDLVRVYSGTYAELMPDNERALLMDKDNVVLTAAPGQSVTVVPKAGYRHGLILRGSNVVANGINLKGFNPSIEFGREDKTQRNVVITNIVAETTTPNADGICDYADTNAQGFPSIDGLLLKNVSMTGASLGISCNSGPCKSWRLENVKVVAGGTGAGMDAIGIENGDNMVFYRVEASGAAFDGIDTKATRVVVWDCHLHDLGANGVKFWQGGDIVNTRIYRTGSDAAVQIRGARARILHSVIAFHNYGSGTSYNLTYCYDGPNCDGPIQMEIIDSIIYNTSGGAFFKAGGKLTVENSIFYGMENGTILEWGGVRVNVSDGAGAFSSTGLGGGNIVADPMLDAAMRLRAGSPGINSGKALSAAYPTLDCEGKPRVKSGTPDIGPFEDF